MVRRTVPAALSDVLGGASGLSPLAVRCATGTSRRPHHPESARSALHRYSDEFHVPECVLVVLLDADPVIPDLSPAFSGGASTGAMVVFGHCMCRRIFRALHVACSLAPKWPVGVRWFCDLPLARVRAGHIARHVAQPIDRTC